MRQLARPLAVLVAAAAGVGLAAPPAFAGCTATLTLAPNGATSVCYAGTVTQLDVTTTGPYEVRLACRLSTYTLSGNSFTTFTPASPLLDCTMTLTARADLVTAVATAS
jgi:hypothetical protein